MPTVIILASGQGRRFTASGGSGDKLQAQLAGKPVLQHVIDAVKASGLPWHLEDRGHPGMGDSIAAAVKATPQANGWLILPGDLPLIRPETLRAVAAALTDAEVVVPNYGGKRGHPVGFSARCAAALRHLTGEQGAASIVLAHAAIELMLDDAGCVTDIDTLADLQMAQQICQCH